MNNKPVINRALIADGLLFNTPGDRCRYLGKWSWEKPRWLRENAGKYRRLEDGEQQSAALCSSIENDENGAPPTRSNSETSSPAVRKGGDNDNEFSLIGTPPQDCSPPTQQAALLKDLNQKFPNSTDAACATGAQRGGYGYNSRTKNRDNSSLGHGPQTSTQRQSPSQEAKDVGGNFKNRPKDFT